MTAAAACVGVSCRSSGFQHDSIMDLRLPSFHETAHMASGDIGRGSRCNERCWGSTAYTPSIDTPDVHIVLAFMGHASLHGDVSCWPSIHLSVATASRVMCRISTPRREAGGRAQKSSERIYIVDMPGPIFVRATNVRIESVATSRPIFLRRYYNPLRICDDGRCVPGLIVLGP